MTDATPTVPPVVRRRWRWLALGLALVALVAAAVLIGPFALSGPQIVRTTPSDGAAAANPQATIELELSQWVSADALRRALRIEPPVGYTVTVDGYPLPGHAVAVIRPDPGLDYNTRYQLAVDGQLANWLGRSLAQPVTVAFTTLPYATVKRVGPDNGAQSVALRTPLTVEFAGQVVADAAIQAAAQNPALAAELPQPLQLSGATKGVGRWLSPTLLSFYPEGGWQAATTYTVTLDQAVNPQSGAQLPAPVAWHFTTAATVLDGVRPFDGATAVAPNTPVEVRLAPGVDPELARALFTLRDVQGSAPIAGTAQVAGGHLLFTPSAPLRHGQRYEGSLAAGVRSLSGAAINAQPLTWSFTVVGDVQVAQVEPQPSASEVLTTTRRISVRFNHPVVAVTTLAAQQTQPQPLQITPALAGVGRWLDTRTYVFSPTAALAPATTYTAAVAAGLRDQTGGTLQAEYRWTFSTITPQVSDSRPLNGENQANPTAPLRVIFNQPMSLDSLRQTMRLERGGAAVPGTITVAGSRALFTPAAPLERGASYVLSVAGGTATAAGTATLTKTFQSTFRVAPLPALLGSTPAGGSTAVEVGGGLSFNFSTALDWPSVERNLVIEPKPTAVYTSGYETQFSYGFPLKPETDYRVTLGGAAHDPYGVALGQDSVITFRTGSLPRSLAIVANNQLATYNAHVAAQIPVRHIGTPEVEYSVYRVAPEQVIPLSNSYEAFQNFQPPATTMLKNGTAKLAGERNQERIDLVNFGQLEAGIYFLRVRAGDLMDRQLMVVSPYALTLKRSADQVFIWAVDLASGAPVAELPLVATAYAGYDKDGRANTAPVEARELGRTDADGVLKVAFSAESSYLPLYVWSAGGAQFTFVTSGWSDGIGPWDFNLPSDATRSPLVGNLSTDRPIYRPQQTVYVRGALRVARDERYQLPTAAPTVRLTISDPNGNAVLSTTLELSEFGTFHTNLALQQSAALGTYNMVAQLPSDPGQSFYGSFTVAEYRKPAFELTVTASQPDVIQGQPLQMQTTAAYFSGGKVANAPVRWRLLAAPLYWQSEAAPSYQFEDLEDAYAAYRWFDNPQPFDGRELIAEGTGTTDAQGNFTLPISATLGKANHSRALTLDVDVSDLDGQVISGQGAANVHAGSFYIGVRPEGYVAEVGKPQAMALITLDPQGNVVPNRSLKVSILRREWFSAREQGADVRLYWTSRYTDTLVETKVATTDAQGRGSVSLTPTEGGSYRVVAEGRDDAGHLVKASAYTWAFAGDTFWGVNDTNRVDLIADKAKYQPGDTASILVPAPYKGMRALLTIERGQVIEHRTFTMNGTTELVQVPITAAYAPNVYVSVVLVKGSGGELPVPDLRIGLINLPVSTAQQELTIAVSADKTTAGPRDTVTYTVKTTDYRGQPVRAEVGLALADKAALSLADDPNPTLRQSFYEKRPLGVFTAQSLTVLVDRLTLKLQPGSKGGGGGLASEVLVRRNVPDTAYWNPSLVTDASGTAQITVTLPDNLTTWRMTARGLTADTQVGQTTADLVATRPLLIRPTLPRFLTVGDALVIQAVVQNTTASSIAATAALDPGTLVPGGPTLQNVEVPANGQVLVRWPVTVPAAGLATLTLRVQGGGREDAVEQTLPVQRFTSPEVVASAGQVDATTIETLAPPAGLPAATSGLTTTQGEFELELVPSLAAGIQSSLDFLGADQYGCAEQTVSAFLPNAATYRLYKQLGRDDPALKAALERNLAAGLQRLYALQHLDGGWGWCGDQDSRRYTTGYVVQGLLAAQQAGQSVEPKVLDAGLAYLGKALGGSDLDVSATLLWPGNTRAYLLFVLAEGGRADRGRTVALFEQRAKLSIFARAYLLMTLKTLGGEDERVTTLVNELMGSALLQTTDAHWEEAAQDYWTMSSDNRTTALALQALVRADPSNFLVPNAVRFLMAARRDGHWASTHESAVTLLALGEYLAASGELDASYAYRAALDGKTLAEGSVSRDNLATPANLVIALAELKSGGSQLALQRQAASGQTGSGRLYYTLRLHTYTAATEVATLDQGIGVERTWGAVDTTTLSPTGQLITSAALGEVVEVRLHLTVPADAQYVTVEDWLPAGLEPLDASLKTVTAAAQAPTIKGGALPSWSYFGRSEIRDNRVALFATNLPKGSYDYTYLARASTPGTFGALPARAFQTYSPEVFGRSAGGMFEVTEK